MIKRYRKNVKGFGKIIPKSINVDGQNQPIKTYEQVFIDKDGISFDKGYDINIDYLHEVELQKPIWKHTGRYKWAPAGALGGKGGAVTNNAAVSRIEVMDPHLLVMMRDIMDSSETAARLKPQGQATGGGGGGGGSQTGGDSAAEPTTVQLLPTKPSPNTSTLNDGRHESAFVTTFSGQDVG